MGQLVLSSGLSQISFSLPPVSWSPLLTHAKTKTKSNHFIGSMPAHKSQSSKGRHQKWCTWLLLTVLMKYQQVSLRQKPGISLCINLCQIWLNIIISQAHGRPWYCTQRTVALHLSWHRICCQGTPFVDMAPLLLSRHPTCWHGTSFVVMA